MKKLIALLLLLTTSAFAADQIYGLDGNNLLLDNASRKWNALVNYTTDGNGNVIPISFSGITIGTVSQGGLSGTAAPWLTDFTTIMGAAPSATNYVPSRISNGTIYVDPTQIRNLIAASDSVTVQGGNSVAVKVDGSAVTQPVSIASPVPVTGTVTANIGTTGGLALDSSISSLSAKFGALGQNIMAGSAPVVIASDQSAITVAQATGSNLHMVVDSGTVTANQGGAPWADNITQILGAAPSVTNWLPSRISNGTSYVDPTQIRALAFGTDSVTVQGGNSTAVKVDGSAVTQPVSGSVTVSGTVTADAGTGTFTVGQATGTNLHTVVDSGTVTANQGGAPWADNITQLNGASFSATNYLPARISNGTVYVDPTQIRSLASGTDSVTVQGGNSTAVKVDGSAVTQPVSGTVTANAGTGNFTVVQPTGTSLHTVVDSGTVTANIGTSGSLALNTSLIQVQAAIGTPIPANAVLVGGSDGTNIRPLSTTAAGKLLVDGGNTTALKVDGSAVTQPVSGTVAATQSGAWSQRLQDGAGNAITSQVSGSQRALDMGINVAGAQVDPRAIRALTSSDVVTANIKDGAGTSITLGQKAMASSLPVAIASDQSAFAVNQGTANSIANGWPIKITDGTNTVAVKAASTAALATDPSAVVAISPNTALPTGSNTIGVVNQGSTPASLANAWTVQPTDGTNAITIKAASTASIATDTAMVTALSPNTPLPAGTAQIGAVSLGNSTGKSIVLSPGTLTSTANTADQVVVTYTVTAGKTFYLQDWDVYVQRSTFNTTVADYGNCSLESPAGAKLWTQELSGAGFASWDKHIAEPAPIASGTVVRIVCTPNAATSTLWRANLIGYEK